MDAILLLSRYFYYKPIDLRKILEEFKNIEDTMTAPKDAFLNLGVSGKALDAFFEQRDANDANSRENTANIKIITILDADYPAALKNIYDAPPILFYRGDLAVLSRPALAVVGSRKASEYGRRAADFFVSALAPHFIIVSGLAYGIDSLAHEAAVKNGGAAAAVLGSGLDDVSIYPKSNLNLAEKIVSGGGLLLSEIPPGTGPQKFHFPMRNRIIAGLARGILIIEAGEKSGTLITAKFGLECGADIFAVPGNIFSPTSAGVNYLIKCGAHPVSSPKDILEFYGIAAHEKEKSYEPKNDLEKAILENLDAAGTADELAALTNSAIADVMGALTDLEMAGVIKNFSGKYAKDF